MSVGTSIMASYKPKKIKLSGKKMGGAYKAPDYTKAKVKPVKVKGHKIKP